MIAFNERQQDISFPLLGMMPVAVILLDKAGHITHANELAQSYLGTSLRRLSGLHLSRFIQPSSEVESMLSRALLGETVADDGFCGRDNHIPYSLHFSCRHDEAGVVIALIPEANRSEVEEHAHRHEMAEAVARIALEMAHEVKNPLASLRGAAQLLHEQSEGDAKEISQHIMDEVDRIRQRIDLFLQVGPHANIAKSTVNIHAMIDDVCANAEDVCVQRVFDPSVPDMLLHKERFRQAIENLWQNALEAGADRIVWETRVAPLVALRGHHGTVLELCIRSNGKSIPENLKDRLFEPYVSGKARGSGLGLAIVQRVMQEHGGRISIKSRRGETCFVMHLPVYKGNQEHVCTH
ncbi:MAG: ATP-binding protein [Mariprofundaceae bacterium]|nr:ATP-binding protein [Mariprofundaceae bacterium]